VNFGFNIEYWDKLHGTYRQKDKIYRENIFYGKGKSVTEATKTELAEEMAERQSENPLAFDDNTHQFELDLKKNDWFFLKIMLNRFLKYSVICN